MSDAVPGRPSARRTGPTTAPPAADRPRGAAAPRPRTPRPPGRWRVALWRLRLPFAATMLGCAAALALADLRPPPPARAAVVVTARVVHAGDRLEAADLTVVHLPPDAVAVGAHHDPGDALGRTVVVALPPGLPVVDGLLRDDGLAAAGPPGTVVVPVRLADPGVAALLRAGDRVDLFAAATSGTGEPVADALARRALVLPHPAGLDEPEDPGLLGPAPDDTGALTLVAVTPGQAAALAGASSWAAISAVVVG